MKLQVTVVRILITVCLEDSRISFIDTDGTFNTKTPIKGIIRLLDEDISSYYSPEAGDYILDKIGYHYAKLSRKNQSRYKQMMEELLEDQHPHIKTLLLKSIRHHRTMQ